MGNGIEAVKNVGHKIGETGRRIGITGRNVALAGALAITSPGAVALFEAPANASPLSSETTLLAAGGGGNCHIEADRHLARAGKDVLAIASQVCTGAVRRQGVGVDIQKLESHTYRYLLFFHQTRVEWTNKGSASDEQNRGGVVTAIARTPCNNGYRIQWREHVIGGAQFANGSVNGREFYTPVDLLDCN